MQRRFLIVGAMKAGTTTLYRDLSEHPEIFLPAKKEPKILVEYGSVSAQRSMYARLWRDASPDQACGEASTHYTKRPDYEHVAERAHELFGPELRIIYLERDPIARAISHYRHEFVGGTQHKPIDEALLSDARYTDYGRYDWQIAPWVEVFGADNVLRLRFEAYVADRPATVLRAIRHIGVSESLAVEIDSGSVYNSSSEKFVARGLVKSAVTSDFFQYLVKPLVPEVVKEKAMPLFYKKAVPSQGVIADETRAVLLQRLSEARTEPTAT